jgi:ATP phosphoribosyltransferase
MSLFIAVPSKGRLMENTFAFFERAGLKLLRPRGERDYRGLIKGVDDVEILFLSASEIANELATGNVHFGVTGADLIYENIRDADAKVELLAPLNFGYADVVVAVPETWIDVRTMRDLDDVAGQFRATHGERLRVATKYINLTRKFFSEHGISDYRIVESHGATEGAPASGAAELIVDITSTGSTIAANALKIPDDGLILKSEAYLVASLKAEWGASERALTSQILDRIASEQRGRSVKELRTRVANLDMESLKAKFNVSFPFGAATSTGMVTLHARQADLYALTAYLREKGAETVTVSSIDHVFTPENPLFERLSKRIKL